MTGKIGRKKVLKFRDFPTRLHGEVFFVENGYDEKLNLSIINHLVDINNCKRLRVYTLHNSKKAVTAD